MKRALCALGIVGLAAVSGLAHADTKKPVALWLCSDYLEVDETTQPTALGFAEAINRQGKPEEAVLDVEGITKIKPAVLTYCKENPKIALRDALVQTWAKAKK
ncbi:acid-activated periplasmic chaperone HdeA [Achromobacter seleniivolatilans]|uniref:Acid-activated periplasmic chaperone HdeA n=1 Tax=Achromobacter seleniivolatilans TaxID=3047478 RepID=A0ABY9LV30_9BURK|nr:acid-activated periplasmic chaperone HdeA [Achromobacter sp. R39]WMD18637.1 acid-activated periplasmic chaperone HdeA [Achromobacter sp. R39]